jgi:hypothetical protein
MMPEASTEAAHDARLVSLSCRRLCIAGKSQLFYALSVPARNSEKRQRSGNHASMTRRSKRNPVLLQHFAGVK